MALWSRGVELCIEVRTGIPKALASADRMVRQVMAAVDGDVMHGKVLSG